MEEKYNFKGLRNILIKFDENGKIAEGTHWKIAKGGYDLWWEIYYDNIPVLNCVGGKIKSFGYMNKKQFNKACKIILDTYGKEDFSIKEL